jgi:hypothetical protein
VGRYKPARPLKDIIDEAEADERFEGPIPGNIALKRSTPQTLYVCRKVLNGADLVKWAKAAGFESTYPAEDMHVTVAFSRTPVDWMEAGQACYSVDGKADLMVPEGGPRRMERFGPLQDIGVLLFASSELKWRHDWLEEIGCSWDWPDYTPHITVSQSIGNMDLSTLEAYQGPIHLGPEIFAPVKENWREGVVEKSMFFKVSSVDAELGLVFGWGIVCKDWDARSLRTVDYYDVQKNHIPEGAMLEATTEFMKRSRMAGEQHARMEAGQIVHSFPLTGEVWKAMFMGPDGKMLPGLPDSPPKTGWMVAAAPDPEMLKGFKSGKLTGFSIGGAYLELDGVAVSDVGRAA